MLDFSRKQELALAPVDLNLTMKHVMKICNSSIDKSVELDFKFNDDVAMVDADPTQLEQVLLNLCINASHSMTIMRKKSKETGGKLTVAIERFRADNNFIKLYEKANNIEYWMLIVSDTGIGMSNDIKLKIFDPFFTTKKKGVGTGLGLAMVYNIIKQHKGFIDVYSEEGIGTTFKIYLPILYNEKTTEQKSENENIEKGEGLILVIDDEEIMATLAKDILEECGYQIIFANDGKEGLEVFKNNYKSIKAVLLDMIMPKMDGKSTYINMKKINPDIKVLLTSGFKQDDRVNDILSLGVQGFIQKPYSFEKLAKSMMKLIKGIR